MRKQRHSQGGGPRVEAEPAGAGGRRLPYELLDAAVSLREKKARKMGFEGTVLHASSGANSREDKSGRGGGIGVRLAASRCETEGGGWKE